jgi:outer membrane receptor protein involved in Fe transport
MVGGQLIGLQENSSRLPNQKSVDLYINRRIDMAGLEWNFFINVYNLFDQRDETNVYSDTGTAEYSTNIDPKDYGYDPRRIGTINDFVNQPGWYTSPRQVQIGLAVNF